MSDGYENRPTVHTVKAHQRLGVTLRSVKYQELTSHKIFILEYMQMVTEMYVAVS